MGLVVVAAYQPAEQHSKSPFAKGGLWGIFNKFSRNPPCPPFTKGGNLPTSQHLLGCGNLSLDSCMITLLYRSNLTGVRRWAILLC
jgi:hypothetical protein